MVVTTRHAETVYLTAASSAFPWLSEIHSSSVSTVILAEWLLSSRKHTRSRPSLWAEVASYCTDAGECELACQSFEYIRLKDESTYMSRLTKESV